MKNATKKWLIVAGGLAACAALVFIIAGQFEKKPVNDTLPPPSSSSQGGVMVDEPDSSISPEKDDPEITVKPETPDTSSTPETGNSGSGAVASGTEQTIQGDPEKPEYDDEALKDLWGDRIFEKCGIGRDERGDGGKTPEIRGKRRLSARDGGANYQQS